VSRAPGPLDARALLGEAGRAALTAVDAASATRRALWEARANGVFDGARSLVVLALGKAAPGMARAVVELDWPCPVTGLVVTKDDHALGFELAPLEVIEAAHPIPDARSAEAGRRAYAVAARTHPSDHLLVLLSGGASALIALPPDEVALHDFIALNDRLLGSGAPIGELNAVRKHLSQVSGGQLARAARAERISLFAISDVPGDDLGVIGSGPCSADASTFGDALAILERRLARDLVPESVGGWLRAGAEGNRPETVKQGEAAVERVRAAIIARNADARGAAVAAALAHGVRAVDLGECLTGEAKEFGRAAGVLAAAVRTDRPTLLVAGGETVVTLRQAGRGGRNQELALAAALGVAGSGVSLLAFGTDGTDGPTDAAGAWVDGSTLERARAAGLDPARHLAGHDAHPFFDRLGDLHRTGPTGTNVMDLLLIWLPAGLAGPAR